MRPGTTGDWHPLHIYTTHICVSYFFLQTTPLTIGLFISSMIYAITSNVDTIHWGSLFWVLLWYNFSLMYYLLGLIFYVLNPDLGDEGGLAPSRDLYFIEKAQKNIIHGTTIYSFCTSLFVFSFVWALFYFFCNFYILLYYSK